MKLKGVSKIATLSSDIFRLYLLKWGFAACSFPGKIAVFLVFCNLIFGSPPRQWVSETCSLKEELWREAFPEE